MPGTLTNVEEDRLLKDCCNYDDSGTNLTLHLFTNDLTISDGTFQTSDFTEAAGGGYSAITLTGSSWTPTPGAPSQVAYAQQQFDFTGALTSSASIYGWFLKRGTVTIAAENLTDGSPAQWPSAFQPAANGDNVAITPIIRFGSTTAD